MHLTDRQPHLDAHALIGGFVPPHRFEDARFETYRPDVEHPSQALACAEMHTFAESMRAKSSSRRFWQRWPAKKLGKLEKLGEKPGNVGNLENLRKRTQATTTGKSTGTRKAARYLDGGFGVGKTHLLAALWHECPSPKAYLTFTELTAFIGFTGMQSAIEAFRHHRLLCIDEFELDDVANTLMVVSFLRGTMAKGLHLAVTSNTLPESLGEKRFSAADFRREIAAIASYFTELRVDGADYRTSHVPEQLVVRNTDTSNDSISKDNFDTLLPHLKNVHPVQYGAMFEKLDGVIIEGMHPIDNQDDALLFVQFVDKLYDARIPVSISGCNVDEVFANWYRSGSYRKKYGRAESRLHAMQVESTGSL